MGAEEERCGCCPQLFYDHMCQIILEECNELGVTVATERFCCLHCLPGNRAEQHEGRTKDKLEHLKETIRDWEGCKACLKRELLSLIGQLSHEKLSNQAGLLSTIPKPVSYTHLTLPTILLV